MSGTTATSDLDRALWALRAYDVTALATVSDAGPHVAGVFFAPEPEGDGLRLILAILRNSRKHRELLADPRVAFMCSPGNPSRWIQGSGIASVPEVTEAEQHALFQRLSEHASGAKAFIDNLPVLPALVEVTTLKVVDPAGSPPLLLDLRR